MKQITQYISEKYLIDINTKSDYTNHIDISKYKKEIDAIYSIIMNDRQFQQHIDVLNACKRQNIDPQKITKHLNENKIVCRWYAAIILEWNDAIETIAKEIEFRKIFDIEALHAFIIKRYETLKFDNTWKQHFENYINLYNLDV